MRGVRRDRPVNRTASGEVVIVRKGRRPVAHLCVVLLLLLLVLPAARVGAAGDAACAQPANVSALAASEGTTILAATTDGLFYQSGAGGCWTQLRALGYPLGIQTGTLLAVPGRPGTLLAGGNYVISTEERSAVLYRSPDGGQTWQNAAAGLPRTAILPVQLAASPAGTLVLAYLCPQDLAAPAGPRRCSRGLARSTDGGRTWQPVGPPAPETRGIVSLGKGAFLALLWPSGRGLPVGRLYRSDDDGRTWQPVGALVPASGKYRQINLGGISGLFAVPWQPARIFAGADIQYLQAAAYGSTDGGAHWSLAWQPATPPAPLTEPFVAAFVGLAAGHTLLFSDLDRVYRSTDDGVTWARAGTGLPAPEGAKIWTLLAAPDGRTAYAGTGTGVYRSTDGGKTWRRLGG